MAKATLSFTLPEERLEHLEAVHARHAFSVLYDLDTWLRGLLKHDGVHQYTADRLAEEVRERVREALTVTEEV